ncbi:MATE family efflux transporter [Roseomonas xinghualingensis]|uniref:MATE family efflux transporter n=1 Tax=Roseomonas xinghualingensis TaxID=2986475 RepID=UPI0021F0F5D3|nr:MATE family efflux transporter [Roseomonas sp. SXEYE001]MCV4207016.1 MATE family efflux transporter [Roseomonas sp. SXEYE001]
MADTLAAPLPRPAVMPQILALAAPTALSAVLQVVGQIAETWLAARQGTAALAGWSVVLPFSLLMQQMSAGAMGGGVASATARALGAGRRDEASALVLHAVLIAILAGGIFAILLAGFPRAVLGLIGGPTAAEAGAAYATWLFGLGAIPVWLANTLASVLRGGGRHALAARVLLLTWVVYPPLAWLLAEPVGMGLPGIGAAMAIAFLGSTIVMGWVVARGGAGFVPALRVRPSRAMFWCILSVGLVASALAGVANLTTILVTARIATHGAAAVAAYGISARLEFLMIPIAFGVGSALTALVGRTVGAGDWDHARRIAWTGGFMALAITSIIGLAVALAPQSFASFFTTDPAVVAIAAQALSWTGLAFGGFGLGMALYFASQGAGRMGWPMAAGVARIAVAVGGGWLLSDVAGLGLDGQFIAVALGITAYGAFTAAGVRPAVWSKPG